MSIGAVSRDGYLQPQPLPQALPHPLPYPQPRCRLTWRHAGAHVSQAQLAQATVAQVAQGAGEQVAQGAVVHGAVAQVAQQVSQVEQHLWKRPAWAKLAKHTIANTRATNIDKRFIQ